MSDQKQIDPQDAMKTLIGVLFTFDSITIHKRSKRWTIKIRSADGKSWVTKTSENIFTAAFLAAAEVMK